MAVLGGLGIDLFVDCHCAVSWFGVLLVVDCGGWRLIVLVSSYNYILCCVMVTSSR